MEEREKKKQERKLKRIEALNEKLNVLLQKEHRSQTDCDEIFRIVIRKNQSIKELIKMIRERN